jgi:valyl-tRNA synthetase
MAPTGEAPGQVDRWLLGELDLLVKTATSAMDRFQFDETFKAIRAFAWEVLADNYIELVKARLYGPDCPEKRSAQNALYTAIETVVLLLAPFTPFISEEIYHSLTGKGVHIQSWPKPKGIDVDPAGLAIKEIAAAMRRFKAEKGMALNAPLPSIVVYSDLGLETVDLGGVANSSVESKTGRPEIEMRAVALKPQMKVLGPKFKDKSGKIIKALLAMDPGEAARQRAAGSIAVRLDGETLEVTPDAVEIITETLSAGEAVDVLKVGDATVLVRR